MNVSTKTMELAKKIAHEIWEQYDDTYGYRSEKQRENEAVPTNHPDNMWFFWNQFDHLNHLKFIDKAAEYKGSPEGDELWEWIQPAFASEMDSIHKLRAAGIDFE